VIEGVIRLWVTTKSRCPVACSRRVDVRGALLSGGWDHVFDGLDVRSGRPTQPSRSDDHDDFAPVDAQVDVLEHVEIVKVLVDTVQGNERIGGVHDR
jgi:hypothetical protein